MLFVIKKTFLLPIILSSKIRHLTNHTNTNRLEDNVLIVLFSINPDLMKYWVFARYE